MTQLNWHTFSDRKRFDRMRKDAVRNQFDARVRADADQPHGDTPLAVRVTAMYPRYRYYLLVDAAVLDSVVRG